MSLADWGGVCGDDNTVRSLHAEEESKMALVAMVLKVTGLTKSNKTPKTTNLKYFSTHNRPTPPS